MKTTFGRKSCHSMRRMWHQWWLQKGGVVLCQHDQLEGIRMRLQKWESFIWFQFIAFLQHTKMRSKRATFDGVEFYLIFSHFRRFLSVYHSVTGYKRPSRNLFVQQFWGKGGSLFFKLTKPSCPIGYLAISAFLVLALTLPRTRWVRSTF